MKLIAITPERIISNEGQIIAQILRLGFDVVHLRHPSSSDTDMANLISDIPLELRISLTLASHQHLIERFPEIGGIHYNSKCNFTINEFPEKRKSKSYHKNDDFIDLGLYDYAFLSPIFDSISKQGYHAAFTSEELRSILLKLNSPKIIALGGITNKNINVVYNLGFGGAAFMGYLFNESNTSTISAKINDLILYK